MAKAIELFVDEMLEDTVRRWADRRDFDPAFARNECTAAGRRRMLTVCRSSHQLEARAMRGQPVDPVVLNNRRGLCAQLVAGQRFCLGPTGARQGADVRNEFRAIARRRDSTRPDILPNFPLGGRTTPPRTLVESKYIHLPSMMAGTRLNAAALAARVRADIADTQRQLAQLRSPQARPGLPARVRMLFQLGGVSPGLPGRAALMLQAAQVVRAAAAQAGQAASVIDADAQRRQVMRHAARLGF